MDTKKKRTMANILIIEDEKAVQENIADLLELNGYNVVLANNGKQGLILTRTIQPDLIISDVAMPVVDGYEFIEKMKLDNKLKNIPVIFLSAKTKPEDIQKGMELGAIDYLTKPYNNNELLKSIKKIVA